MSIPLPGHFLQRVETRLELLLLRSQLFEERWELLMKTLAEVLAKVKEEGTKSASLIVLFKGLKSQLADLLAGNLSPAVQAQVDAVFDQAAANADKIDEAINANVP